MNLKSWFSAMKNYSAEFRWSSSRFQNCCVKTTGAMKYIFTITNEAEKGLKVLCKTMICEVEWKRCMKRRNALLWGAVRDLILNYSITHTYEMEIWNHHWWELFTCVYENCVFQLCFWELVSFLCGFFFTLPATSHTVALN